MTSKKFNDYPELDRADKLLKVAEAYFDTTIEFCLSIPYVQALHRAIDKNLNTIRERVPFESIVEARLRDKKMDLHMVLRDQVANERKGKRLPKIDLDPLLNEIEELRSKKVA